MTNLKKSDLILQDPSLEARPDARLDGRPTGQRKSRRNRKLIRKRERRAKRDGPQDVPVGGKQRPPPSKSPVLSDRLAHVKPDRHKAKKRFKKRDKTARGGRPVRIVRSNVKHSRKFDSTLGYPGEGPETIYCKCNQAATCVRNHFHPRKGKAKTGAARRKKEEERKRARYVSCIDQAACVDPTHYHPVRDGCHDLTSKQLIDAEKNFRLVADLLLTEEDYDIFTSQDAERQERKGRPILPSAKPQGPPPKEERKSDDLVPDTRHLEPTRSKFSGCFEHGPETKEQHCGTDTVAVGITVDLTAKADPAKVGDEVTSPTPKPEERKHEPSAPPALLCAKSVAAVKPDDAVKTTSKPSRTGDSKLILEADSEREARAIREMVVLHPENICFKRIFFTPFTTPTEKERFGKWRSKKAKMSRSWFKFLALWKRVYVDGVGDGQEFGCKEAVKPASTRKVLRPFARIRSAIKKVPIEKYLKDEELDPVEVSHFFGFYTHHRDGDVYRDLAHFLYANSEMMRRTLRNDFSINPHLVDFLHNAATKHAKFEEFMTASPRVYANTIQYVANRLYLLSRITCSASPGDKTPSNKSGLLSKDSGREGTPTG